MSLKDRLTGIGELGRRAAQFLAPESAEERRLRIDNLIRVAGHDVKSVPDLTPFSERYGDLAGHALTLARLPNGSLYDGHRRDIHSSIAAKFTEAIRQRDYPTVESATRLLLDNGSDVVLPVQSKML